MRLPKPLLQLFLLALVGGALIAHPHLRKSITTTIGGVEATLSFYTAPANEEHVKNVAQGSFAASPATLTLSADLSVGGQTIPAGTYTLGAIKNGTDDWTMALSPGKLGRGESADMSRVIKLKSMFSRNEGVASHIYYDILPGHGPLEGHAVLVWHFGSLYLAGTLTDRL